MAKVRQARVDEFEHVLAFYAAMIDGMRGTDFDVCWEHGVHPSSEFLRSSLEAGQVFVAEAEAEAEAQPQPAPLAPVPFAAAMVLNDEGAPGYDQVPWRVQANPDEVLVIHVLGTLPAYHGRGYARAMVEACIDEARRTGMKAVRLDTFPFNMRARRLYESCGFVDVGTFALAYDNVDDGAARFVMYERAL